MSLSDYWISNVYCLFQETYLWRSTDQQGWFISIFRRKNSCSLILEKISRSILRQIFQDCGHPVPFEKPTICGTFGRTRVSRFPPLTPTFFTCLLFGTFYLPHFLKLIRSITAGWIAFIHCSFTSLQYGECNKRTCPHCYTSYSPRDFSWIFFDIGRFFHLFRKFHFPNATGWIAAINCSSQIPQYRKSTAYLGDRKSTLI